MSKSENKSDKAIYRMCIYTRGGDIEGIFIADKRHIEYMVEHELYVHFGEILGKHSDVSVRVCDNEIKMLSDEPEVLDFFEKYDFSSGYNPLFTTFDPFETDEFDEPDNGIEWSGCVVDEWIDYKLDGIIPEYYKDEYEKWLSSQKEDE